ncbi:hypothetical protein [Nocardiopsis sp. LOL_012]|uniref:hypothetical protein n=1 Tax=Nocardiopsis sp. LOL_012 TaxID=3345409 RepID=UPI003A86133A
MDGDRRNRRGPRLAHTLDLITREIGVAWAHTCAQWQARPGTADEADLADLVAGHPDQFEWRVVEAALARLECPACTRPLGSGKRGCPPCDGADGLRFAARESDRPAVPAGSEHALHVAWAVSRTPHRHSVRAVCGFELALPGLHAGELPTTAQAQRARALINRLTEDQCRHVSSFDDVLALARSAPPR